jgi:alanyl-tRNA synthetase
MKTVSDIRTAFTDFFVSKGHAHVASSPLVPQNDPTLMFANSGMVQFKNVFTGVEKRPYTRATTSQKCVRAGGKHNDLENVGYTARHLTFFEMLGNFSFGDYFKEDAISFAWELVTKNLGLDKSKLLVTVYHEDAEAAALWKKIAGFSDDKIIRIKTNDNFWMMGDTGPCGPCSEIFYDKGAHIAGGPPGSPDEDGDRFMEFYNLVFMQYEQFNDGRPRIPLPKPSIDTGMGLERMATLLQGKESVFEIDLLHAIIRQTEEFVKVKENPSHRVIADHLRASAFLMADGVMPSNEGRGYVLRRIMRRGMRHAHLLGAKEPLMYRLLPTLTALMGDAYPELKRAESMISEMLKLEETRFKRTLDNGLRLLDEETGKLKAGDNLPGDVAFKLYDTFGFPVDLTQDALRPRKIGVDIAGFDKAMEKQRAEARKSWAGSGDVGDEKIWFEILDKVGPTEFLGYSAKESAGKITAILKDGKLVNELKYGETGYVITNQTPFYAESGGQVGDHGTMVIEGEGDGWFAVDNTQKKLGKIWAHHGKVEEGEKIKVGESPVMKVDAARRAAIESNHSATHLLHEALRRVLGEHVAQKGSLQDPQRTRFDISHQKAITHDEIRRVETIVNNEIRANNPVVTRIMPLDEARDSGARALFGEKYEDEVRVVSMGSQAEGANHPFSVELCGGTHVKNTGDIGLLYIVGESAAAAGVRRVEALTGENALRYFWELDQRMVDLAGIINSGEAEVVERVRALADDKKRLENEVSNLRRQLATGGGGSGSGASETKDIGGVKFAGRVLAGFPAKDLKPMVDDLKKKIGSGVVALVATDDGKASLVVGVTDDLTGRISAVELVKVGAAALGGKGGGGRPDMAQAGGPNADAANDAVNAIEKALAS